MILIHNAEIADGSGGETYIGWLTFDRGRIIALGKGAQPDCNADKAIDAQGLLLCPGFIDTHTHSDMAIFDDPCAESALAQGVTTQVTGNCGLSPFPVTPLNRAHLETTYAHYSRPLAWTDFKGYADAVDACHPAINIVPQTGHNTIRFAVLGYERKLPSDNEMYEMRQLLDTTLSQGACGMSLGLLYVPGRYAETDEIIQLLEPLARHGKVLNAHLRSEAGRLLEAVDEMFEFQDRAQLPRIHISHLKTALPPNWPKIDALLERIRSRPSVTVDRYPYTEGMTSLSIVSPAPYDDMPDAEISKVLQDEDKYRAFLLQLSERSEEYWDAIRLADTSLERFQPFRGRLLSEIARTLNVRAAEIYAELVRNDAVNAMGAFGGMSPDNMKRIAALPQCACGSDEQLRKTDGSMGRGHPRGYGSFPRFFNLVSQTLPRGEVVRKMTSLPAKVFNIPDRGRLVPGAVADLVLLDPANYADPADFENPLRLAMGVRQVWVNGETAWKDGESVGRHGKVIRIC